MQIIDITRELFSAPVYPGDVVPALSWSRRMAAGDAYNYSQFLLGAHAGSHADAPLHFLPNGADVTTLPMDVLIGECHVLDVPPGELTGAYVEQYLPGRTERVLLKGRGQTTLSESAAEELAARGVKLVGTDAMSIAPQGNERPPHFALLREGIVILENLDLSAAPPGKYFLVAAPLKLAGAEAAPLRAFLMNN
ncbi:MAG: cyclase family protein [Oscillospiraceae bacterium]|jgi:arylformamidase|nr:cyclase family protein [Oscillospiraceae bacterium]